MTKLAPVILFTYNRLSETKRTVEALSKNFLSSQTDLIIYSDGAKDEGSNHKIKQVREYLKSIKGFKSVEIIESTYNKGLADSIIYGVTEVLKSNDSVIVLEDDLVTTSNFLSFMNYSLNKFKTDLSIYAVNGYSPKLDVGENYTHYFHPRAFPWGWGTWKENWENINFDKKSIKNYLKNNSSKLIEFKKSIGEDSGKMLISSLKNKNNSWYIRWVFDNFLNQRVSFFPVTSKVQNIGFTLDATHCDGISVYESITDKELSTNFDFNNEYILKYRDKRFLKYFSIKYKILFRLRLLFKKNGVQLIFQEVIKKIK